MATSQHTCLTYRRFGCLPNQNLNEIRPTSQQFNDQFCSVLHNQFRLPPLGVLRLFVLAYSVAYLPGLQRGLVKVSVL